MIYDMEMQKTFYASYAEKVEKARKKLGRAMTLAEKILYAHLYDENTVVAFRRGEEYVNFRPDRVAMQDATAQMALLQFMNAGKSVSAVPATVHCDHLIQAYKGVEEDLPSACTTNKEVYDFLKSVASKYGIGFWKPGAGIIHQVVLENYAFPGGMMVGTDSHTPNAGGLGMIAIGVGGADAVDVMTGMEWELKMPKLIGVKLTGALNGWASPKDVILKLAGILTVKGGTNAIIEYFGEGTRSLSATGKATICNMGAEVGATTSVFPYDEEMKRYLCATGREDIAELAEANAADLRADAEVAQQPEKYYDRLIEIDLSALEPYVNGPFTPDAACPVSEFAARVKKEGFPQKMEVGLIGSCTNSSYQDLSRAASVARQVKAKGLKMQASLIINPGSEQVYCTAQRDGMIEDLKSIGGVVMTNACGPCIGQWKRVTDDPLRDTLKNEKGEEVRLDPPTGETLPLKGFTVDDNGYVAPSADGGKVEVTIQPDSQRLQKLEPFAAWNGEDFMELPLLIKTQGKCTTDHISMAGPWLRFRGHLENISDNMLMGAVNAFNGKTNCVWNQLTGEYEAVSAVAKQYKAKGMGSIVVAEENYGEGSSREHAAMEPRFLNVRVILAKSFARIHETNLKKQGMLALTFADKNDYDKVREHDRISILGLQRFAPGKPLHAVLTHEDGTTETFEVLHTYNEMQINWFKAGSALNTFKK